LEQLHRDYGPRGLTVLGFPCNQHGHQEPGDAPEIARFCQTQYDVTFPLSEKVEVNGDQAHPLFRYLKRAAPGVLGTESIKWNFTKFLVDRQGHVVARYAPNDTPQKLRGEIDRLLSESSA
jgi:glutathione peroxidase